MRTLNKSKRVRLAGPLVALGVLATFAALSLQADESPLGTPAAPDPAALGAPAAPAAADMPVEAPAAADATAAAEPASTDEVTVTDEVIPLRERDDAGVETAEAGNLINVTVENETLENVVNMFARISGANIVTTSADLGGTVTVNLRGVEWKPALSSILDVHNLQLVEKLPGSGVYTIIPKPAGEAEPMIVQTIFLNFTTVAEMGPMARSMLGVVSNAAVTEFPTRNAMVIKTTEANMREIQSLVKEMDVPGRQVVVETKFMELSDGASKKVGIRWDSLDEYGVRVTPQALYEKEIERVDTRDNMETHSDERVRNSTRTTADTVDDSTEALFKKDGTQYERTDLTVFDPDPENPGNPLTIVENVTPTRIVSSTDASNSEKSDTRTLTDSISSSFGDTYEKTVTEATTAILDFDTFNAVISALEKTSGVTVISNPKLIVASGSKDAYFTVGDREPLIRTEIQKGTQDSPGDTIIAELDTEITTEYIKQGYLETGIHLQVIPVVKTEDLIEAVIEPKLVRRILPDKIVGDNSWPRIAVKELKTTFTLRSGQTVAIGGLTDTSDDVKVTKIPLLGDIPLIGKYLFSHKADVKQQVETIIFVTLSLAEAQNLYREAGVPEEAELVHKQLIKREQRRENFERELDELRKAKEEASKQPDSKRSRTRKRQ